MNLKKEMRTRALLANRTAASNEIATQLEAWKPLHGRVLSYLAMADEPDLGAIHGLPRISIAVTRIDETGTLTVHHYDPESLETHRYGVEQPMRDAPEVPLDELDVVLIPGLMFDRSGNRLGRGKGYYDELLARIPVGVVRVGVTLAELFVDSIPTEDHDQRVTWVVTESGVHRVGDELSDATQMFVVAALDAGIAPDIHRFPKGTKTSQDAADAVGCSVGEIAKSILFAVDDEFVLVLCSGDRRIDEVRLAEECGAEGAKIARMDDVKAITGYVAGGTPGVGLDPSIKVLADVGLARYRWVWSAGGSPDTVYPVSVGRLVAASSARWADVTNEECT